MNIIHKSYYYHLFLLLQVRALVVPIKLVELVDIGTLDDFFSEFISFRFLYFLEISGIIARIKESLC